ncbi:hypothetical protein [Botrimarina hoheduenensis]|uniref:Replication initiator protein A n=1 Tax=Botrimarina hoheduenensis TaxID=2528000 RepID=A0A5C5WE06_9BACT|nr:hypothetical protein [Botrimarina hoheduenensis]TWT48954.1 hypothetical protein Pla111_07320 [Botrimarina hoheduenensis]
MNAPASSPSSAPATLSAGEHGRHILRVESNLLGFPFFALSTKGLARRKYLQVTGTKYLPGGERRDFSLTVSRSATRYYPGPLARKIHYALTDILQDRAAGAGDLLTSPVAFSWRNLHERMEVAYHGATSIQRAKDALFDTVGATVFTDSAFMQRSGDSRAAMPTRETGYHLYDRCVFINDPLATGGVSDKNAVWLADWYLANLNALMTAPIDYHRWLRMNHASPLASRLYEFLLVKFRRDIPFLQINYPYFVSFLPATAHPYRAQAMRQLEEPFRVAREHDVLADVAWGKSVDGQLQLKLWPGRAVTERASAGRETQAEDFDRLTVFEGANDESGESELVRRYHALRFDRSAHRPAAAELGYARELLATYNDKLLHRVLPRVADAMRERFPDGRLLGAARPYFEEVLSAAQRSESRRQVEAEAAQANEQHDEAAEAAKRARRVEEAKLRALWAGLDRNEQERLYRLAIEHANSEFQRTRLSRRRDLRRPPREVLLEIDRRGAA